MDREWVREDYDSFWFNGPIGDLITTLDRLRTECAEKGWRHVEARILYNHDDPVLSVSAERPETDEEYNARCNKAEEAAIVERMEYERLKAKYGS